MNIEANVVLELLTVDYPDCHIMFQNAEAKYSKNQNKTKQTKKENTQENSKRKQQQKTPEASIFL